MDPQQVDLYYNYIISNPEFLEQIIKDATMIHGDGSIRIGVYYHCKKILIDQYGNCPYGVKTCDHCKKTFCTEDCLTYCEECGLGLCDKYETHTCISE